MIFRTFSRLSTVGISTILPFKDFRSKDNVIVDKNPTIKTGYDRVRAIFYGDEMDSISPELNSVSHSLMMATFLGVCYGGFLKSRLAYLNFMENNQVTAFTSMMEARRKLQSEVTIAFGKGALQWGWRLAFFTGSFNLISVVISAYRGKTGVIEYSVAGSVTGGLYKIKHGPGGILVGTILGGILGTCGGVVILAILKVSGITMEDVRQVQLKFRNMREEQFNMIKEKDSKEKHDDVTKTHDVFLEHVGEMKLEDVK